MKRSIRIFIFAILIYTPLLIVFANPEPPKSGYTPPVAKASKEGEDAIQRFQRDGSLKVELWAAEPLLAQPVSFTFDEKMRCFVAETFRHSNGVTDNRNHMHWLDDELACRKVADRVALYKKDAKGQFHKQYETQRDRIRMVEDSKGNGKADRSTVFSDNFGRAEDGLGAGLLAHYGDIYYTCIPDLWLLKENQATGYAESQKSLSTGYGIHTAFIGHDLHGLRIGPDGKLYFSCGDRGLNVKTKEGKHIFNPDTGAVLRCDLDGSNLELVHSGLRNPQELAFDDFGNLFTVDNNSDSGDRARFVQIVEGADSGWRIGYQYASSMHDKSVPQANRGPWNYEKLWFPHFAGQAAYILPPIVNFSDGPSGFTYYPGVGLDDKYRGHFFLADFRGSPGGSGIWSFTTKPKGASFEMVNPQHFIWNILATDCDFAPDGAFYVSDWVDGWNLNGKGRIYKISDPKAMQNEVVKDAKELIAGGFTKKSPEELVKLLSHTHQRVRMEAQFALAGKGEAALPFFKEIAASSKSQLARLHAIWGIGMVRPLQTTSFQLLVSLLGDADSEVQNQAIKTLGDLMVAKPVGNLEKFSMSQWIEPALKLLENGSPRAQFLTALALSKMATRLTESPTDLELKAKIASKVFAVLRKNQDKDTVIRHSCIMALAAVGPEGHSEKILDRKEPPSVSERMATVLAYRKLATQKDVGPQIARFLSDNDTLIVAEAARAIHDLPIPTALPALAGILNQGSLSDPVVFRALNANFRLGASVNANAVAEYAGRTSAPTVLRNLAMQMLIDWAKPGRRDFITGLTQSLPPRPDSIAVEAMKPVISRIFTGDSEVQKQAANLAGRLGLKEVGPTLLALLTDNQSVVSSRIEALNALESLKNAKLQDALQIAMKSDSPQLRNAARAIRIKTDAKGVLAELGSVLNQSEVIEMQGALAILAQHQNPPVNSILSETLDKLLAKKLPPEVTLDVLEAASRSKNAAIKKKLEAFEKTRNSADELGKFRETLAGGDPVRGRNIFLNNPTAQCQRCHKLDNQGGEVGPALNGIAAKQKIDYLLEAIILPNKQIAKGYESVQVFTADGKSINGIVKSDDAKELKLMTAEGNIITIAKEDIESRKASKTAMPEDYAQKLSKSDIRDLVAFLASLNK